MYTSLRIFSRQPLLFLALAALFSSPVAAADIELETGVLLIARKDENDPYFKGAVVIVVDHRLAGSRGLVINRPSRFLFGELLFEYADRPSANAHVLFGGPHDTQQLRYLIRSSHSVSNAKQLSAEVWYGPGQAVLPKQAADTPGNRLRLFAGYVNWGPGQLDQEIARGRWQMIAPRPEYIFSTRSHDLWPYLWRKTQKNDWVRVAQP